MPAQLKQGAKLPDLGSGRGRNAESEIGLWPTAPGFKRNDS